MKKLGRVFLALSLMALMAGPALAGLGVDFTGVTIDDSSGNWCLGWKFTTNSPVTITKLGFYDDLQNGLTQNHDVGIYNAAGTLLVSTTVLPTDPLTSWFRFHDIIPLTLPGSEDFYIQGVTESENYTYNPTGFVVNPSISFDNFAWFFPHASVLKFPNYSDLITIGDFGPNFDTTPVPLPPALLLFGSGLLGLGGWRRFRKG